MINKQKLKTKGTIMPKLALNGKRDIWDQDTGETKYNRTFYLENIEINGGKKILIKIKRGRIEIGSIRMHDYYVAKLGKAYLLLKRKNGKVYLIKNKEKGRESFKTILDIVLFIKNESQALRG